MFWMPFGMYTFILFVCLYVSSISSYVPSVSVLKRGIKSRRGLQASPESEFSSEGSRYGADGVDVAKTDGDLKLALEQLGPFLKIATPFFKEDEVARNSLIGVVALTLMNSGVSVQFSYISRDFYNALNTRDETLFYEKIQLFFLALCVAVPLSVGYRFLREKLSLYWREALTTRVLEKYYANRTFYVMETLREVDNPDQRITEDVRAFTRTSLDFFIAIFTSVVDLFSFSAILFNIFPNLFTAIVVYAGAGSLVTTNLGRSLVAKNFKVIVNEANFRFALIRTRENAEAIAFYDPDAELEKENLNSLFKTVLDSQLEIVKTQRNLEFFTTAYRYIPQILPSLIVAPLYFQHKVELGAISQSYGAFNHILGDFSLIINSFESLSAFSAGLTRLTSFLDVITIGGWDQTSDGDLPSFAAEEVASTVGQMRANGDDGEKGKETLEVTQRRLTDSIVMHTRSSEELQAEVAAASIPLDAGQQNSHPILVCRDLSVLVPDGSRAVIGSRKTHDAKEVAGVDFSVGRGEKVIIVGPSGCGKSSLVRAISGLWQRGSGTVVWDDSLRTSSTQTPSSLSSPSSSSSEEAAEVLTEMVKHQDSAPSGVFFLPQKPYNLMGSLRLQITYPAMQDDKAATAPDAKLLDILDRVRLGGLAAQVGGLDAVEDWSKVLSLGEQQRLAFARVLYNRPMVVVLDESTSALDLASEEAMYRLLTNDLQATYISIGHRPSLLKYHDIKLVLGGPGQPVVRVPVTDTAAATLIDS